MNMLRNTSKKTIYIGSILLIVLVLVSVLTTFISNKKNITQTEVLALSSFKNDQYGLSVSYPAEAKMLELSEADQQSNIFLRLAGENEPQYLVTVRAEKGLRLPSQLSKLDVIDLVVTGAIRSNPDRYPGYKQVSETKRTIGEKDAHEIVFTYDGPTGDRAQQALYLIEKDPDTALYISMQALERDFAAVNEKVFQQIVQGLTL
jgi:hypothetical protein